MDRNHAHRLDAGEVIFGRLLQAGEKMQGDDVYDSMTGKWTPVPSAFVGNTVQPKHGATIIRPAVSERPVGGGSG